MRTPSLRWPTILLLTQALACGAEPSVRAGQQGGAGNDAGGDGGGVSDGGGGGDGGAQADGGSQDGGADGGVADSGGEDSGDGGLPDPTAWLPDGRGFYVLSMMGGGSDTTRWSILRTLELTAVDPTQGTVQSESWAWYQDRFTGDATDTKVETGYTTAGGPYTGTIKTPLDFQPGNPGTALTGTYLRGEDGSLTITWSSGKWDRWTLSSPVDYPVTMLTLHSSSYEARHAWGFGSRSPIDMEGASMEQIRAAGDLTFADLWGNNYDADDYQNDTHFPLPSYLACSSQAIMVEEPQELVCDRWHSYVAGDPTVDGRRNYWNHQLGQVGCYESGHTCPDATCDQTTISELGGHTLAMFQVLDDDGVFRGFVATEASLHGRYTGGAIVAASYWMQP